MNPITIVRQLIEEAKFAFGEVERIDVPESVWEPAMDAVANAGGDVGIDYCVVDGVTVRELPDAPEDTQAVVYVAGRDEPQRLSLGE